MDAHTLPPFVQVEGVINMRALGGYKIAVDPTKQVRPGVLYRSGDPSRVTERGRLQLSELGIKQIFDFRTQSEIVAYASATPVPDGIEITTLPILSDQAFDPVSIAKSLEGFSEEKELETFIRLYAKFMDLGLTAFSLVLRHLIEKPDEPCIVHCTAGKDRTGVFAAIFLLLLGVNKEDIVQDYALTTTGLLPHKDALIARFMKIDVIRENWDAFVRQGSSRPEVMTAFLDMVEEKYGGAESYITQEGGLSPEELARLRDLMIVPV